MSAEQEQTDETECEAGIALRTRSQNWRHRMVSPVRCDGTQQESWFVALFSLRPPVQRIDSV